MYAILLVNLDDNFEKRLAVPELTVARSSVSPLPEQSASFVQVHNINALFEVHLLEVTVVIMFLCQC
jgi:hypothetical protein